MSFIVTIFVFFIGASFGSFFKLIVDRYDKEISFIFKPSYCLLCKENLHWWQNIPIVSYLILKGKCYFCKSKIDFNMFLAELITGLITACIFVLNYLKHYSLISICFLILFFLILIFLSFFDLKHRIVPHLVTYSGILIFLTYNWVFHKSFVNSLSSLGLAFIFMDLLYFYSTIVKKFQLEHNLLFIPLILWSFFFLFNQNLYFLVVLIVIYFFLQNCKFPTWFYVFSGIILSIMFLLQLVKISFIDLDFDKLITFFSGVGLIYLFCEIIFYFICLFIALIKNELAIQYSASNPHSSVLNPNITIGGGDITIFALISTYLGFKFAILVLFLASLFALCSPLILKNIKLYVPFVPCLSLACFIIVIIKLLI